VKGTELSRRFLAVASLILAGCVSLALLWVSASRLTGAANGVPLDDAWIHFQFARNLASGNGFSFNRGHPISASTAPLWTLLLAFAYRIVGGGFPLLGQILSSVAFLTMILATFSLGKIILDKEWAAWLAALLVALNGRMAWAGLSALEIGLFSALALLGVRAYLVGRADNRYSLWAASLFGLASLCRPDGYLLFGVSLVDYGVLASPQREGGWRAWLCHLPLWPVLLFVALVSPYLVFSFRTTGHVLPSTYQAKAVVSFRPDLTFISVAAKYLVLDNPPLLPFFAVGLVFLLPEFPVFPLWCTLLPIGYALLHAIPYQHGRYLMPLIPFNMLVGVWGLRKAARLARSRGSIGHLLAALHPTVLCLVMALGTLWRLPVMSQNYADNVENINDMQVSFGKWALENTDPDDVLAVNDIGAIGYISERYIVDLAGLITPEVLPLLVQSDSTASMLSFLQAQDVDYVIIFPNWFPALARQSQFLEPVHTVELSENTIAGGPKMVAYRTHWTDP